MLTFPIFSNAETIHCVDTDSQKHIVKFIEDNIDFAYIDGVEYTLVGSVDKNTVIYKAHQKEAIFYIDVTDRSWFHLLQVNVNSKKDEKQVDFYYAKCDNVNVVK